MTDLIHLKDSYIKEFESEVIETHKNSVILRETAFYPRGGGQPGDTGKLICNNAEYSVLEVYKEGNKVLHPLEKGIIEKGSAVRGIIDWERRYKLMRTHSALHVLCGIIYRDYGALVTGCQMYEDKARMDFALAQASPEMLEGIETKLNKIIEDGRPIHLKTISREEANKNPDLIRTKINLLPSFIKEIRTVEIENLDLQADGGAHVKNTKEIGIVKITKFINKGKEYKRIEIKLGD